jgi:3-isopropylmalate/(R)-2-methylmalate dehydratase large subunit
MVYGGMPFTTDFGVIDRLRAGEDVDTRAFFTALPDFFRAVAESGGLLEYGKGLLAGTTTPTYDTRPAARPLNAVEKIIANKVWTSAETTGVADVNEALFALALWAERIEDWHRALN